MRSLARTPLVLLFAVLALFATACGSTSSGADVATGDSGDTSTASGSDGEQSNTSSDSSGSSDVPESPIADLLGIPISDSGAMDEYFSDLGRQAEVKIAECMLAQGFEYSVVDYGDLGGVSIDDGDDREYAEQYGFGITSNPFEESFEAFEQFEDPNREYVESLSEGEQAAYGEALTGGGFDASADAQTFEPGGCQGEAFEEVFSFATVFEQFGSEFAEIEQAFEADPRIVAARSGWSECMTAAGYRYTDEDGAFDDIRRRYQEIVNNPDAAAETPEGGSSVTIEVTEESRGSDDEEPVIFFGPRSLKPEFQEQVDVLAEEERAIATASWDCNAPLREIEGDIQVEYEQKFVDENGAAIRAALGDS